MVLWDYAAMPADIDRSWRRSDAIRSLTRAANRTFGIAGEGGYAPFSRTLSTTLPYAPKYNFSVGVQYRFDLGSDASSTPRIDVSRVARQFTSLAHDAPAQLPARTLVNLRATYERGDWTAEAFATNLGDKAYPVGRTANLWTYGAPRQLGVRVGRRF